MCEPSSGPETGSEMPEESLLDVSNEVPNSLLSDSDKGSEAHKIYVHVQLNLLYLSCMFV